MVRIDYLKAQEILDSRGEPTLKVWLYAKNIVVCCSVPSGRSKGRYEAVELRDGGRRYQGKGVLKAVASIERRIGPILRGMLVTKQKDIDEKLIELDGTQNKKRLGANAILGTSIAAAKAASKARKQELCEYVAKLYGKKPYLPIPLFNIINGGMHAGNQLDIQEYLLIPCKIKKFSEALRIGSECYHILKNILVKKYGKSAINVGDEGGFAPPLRDPTKPFELLLKCAEKAGYANNVRLGIDCAASTFFKKGRYLFNQKVLDQTRLMDFYLHLTEEYPLLLIEDPFAQDDWNAFTELTSAVKKKIFIVGDDLLVTNPKRIDKAVRLKACNGLLMKPNQIGTLSETAEAVRLACDAGWILVASHRSGDTCDAFISDLASGFGCGFIKAGAPCRGERIAKYNRLLWIEKNLGFKIKRLPCA